MNLFVCLYFFVLYFFTNAADEYPDPGHTL